MQPGLAKMCRLGTLPAVCVVILLISLPGRAVLAQNAASGTDRVRLEGPRGALADSTARGRFSVRDADHLATPFVNIHHRARGEQSRGIRTAANGFTTNADIGDTLTFNVPRTLSNTWEPKLFTLSAETNAVRLWVATNEVAADSVGESDIAALIETLSERTPDSSYDPNRGIVSIAAEVFGPTRDYDGDGLVDILWFDIFDDYGGPGTVFTPVIVSGDDIDPAAPPGNGNQADMIYLDTYPTLNGPEQDIDVARANLAGGYQALIHLNHDQEETTFVRVGLFEWMKVLLGYPGPTVRYAERPGEHNIAFLSYAGFIGDRERAALFMRYLADQLGVESTGVLTRSAEVGAAGLEAMLAASADGRALSDLVADFHTANFVQDKSLDTRFGYADAQLPSPIAHPTVKLDASLNQGLSSAPVLMQPGGVQYIQWENVLDIEIRVDAVDAANRPSLRARAFVESATAGTSVVDLNIQASPQLVPGANDRVTLVLVHDDLAAPAFSVTVGAEWVDTAYETTNIAYDDGQYADTVLNFVTLGQGFIQAVRFQPPVGNLLQKVFLPVVYQNQFIDPGTGLLYGSPLDPRDFTLTIFRDNGFGVPGDTLFQQTISDPRQYGPVTTLDLPFLEVNLDGAEIGGLGEAALFVGISEHGTDSNNLMLGLSTYAAEDVSFVFGPVSGTPEWFPLWNLEVGGESLSGFSIPFRAQFRASEPVGTEPSVSKAERLVIGSYPNPTSDVARVVLDSPASGLEYRAHLVDLLGRRVRSIRVERSGDHRRQFDVDVADLAAGLYFLHVVAAGKSNVDGISQTIPIVVAR